MTLPRVRRIRSVVEEVEAPVKARISRTRGQRLVAEALPFFLIDWRRPLSWKFSIYMVTSFLYYQRSKSVTTDSDFDRLCVELYENYADLEHQHKHLVDRGQLRAGTGYDIDYPMLVRHAAEHLLSHYAER